MLALQATARQLQISEYRNCAARGSVRAALGIWSRVKRDRWRDAGSVDGGIGAGSGLGFDRCAASCSAGSTATPRAGEVAGFGEVVESPASWPLLPLRDGPGFAHVFCDCRSLFALIDEGRRGNFNVGEQS